MCRRVNERLRGVSQREDSETKAYKVRLLKICVHLHIIHISKTEEHDSTESRMARYSREADHALIAKTEPLREEHTTWHKSGYGSRAVALQEGRPRPSVQNGRALYR